MDGSNLKPEPHQPSGGGGSKPKPSEGLGGDSHAQESQLASGDQGQGDGPQKASRIKDSVKDKAGSASETMNDIKDVAKAGPTGLESTGKEIKQGYEKNGAKGAAGAAGREAAGAAAEVGVDVLTGGLGAEFGGKVQKGVSKALKKENLKKIAIGAAIFLSIPLIIIGIIVGVIMYAAANPYKFVEKVISDPKTREFAIQAAKLAGTKIPVFSEDIYKKYGYVEVKPGQAIAAPATTASPKPGSIEEKMLKINIKNARYQSSGVAPDCPYTYTTKDLTDPKTGATTSVIDEVKNKSGEVVDKNANFVVSYCIIQSMPLYNMMVRTQKTRDVNDFSRTTLNYADSKDSTNIKGKSPAEVKKYVYDKTYNRITSKRGEDPTTKIADVDEYILQVRDKLEKDENPDSVQFDFGPDANTDSAITKTLCTFTNGYLSDENIRKGILARLNSGQRSGIKSNTLSSTRELGLLSNEELTPTFGQLDGWSASRAYSQNVYGTQAGTAIDPERLGNTSYGASYETSLSLLSNIKNECRNYKDANTLLGSIKDFLGLGSDPDAIRRNILLTYDALRQDIVDQSNGKFVSIDDFGLDQLMVGVIRMGGGSAVSGLEAGTQNFNNQSQGFRTLSNQYMMRMGGRFLSPEESSQLNALSENTRRDVESKNGLAYRLFAEDNIRSLANIIRYETPRTTGELGRKGKDYIASLANPIKLLADLSSSFSHVVLGKSTVAYAAGETGDAYMRIGTIGLPASELDNTDIIANSNEVQDLLETGTAEQKKVLGYFENCSKANIPTENIFAREYAVVTTNGEVVVDKERARIELDGYPLYPSVANNYGAFRLASKEELMACELYLRPNNPATIKNLGGSVQTRIANVPGGIAELAKKYRLYLYANSMVDLMVELSSTEKTESIYANSATASQPAPGGGGGGGGGGVVAGDTSNLTCAAGTDAGIGDGYAKGKLYKIRLCTVGGITVNAQIASNVQGLLNKSISDGLKLTGGGFRTMQQQISLRTSNGCPDVYDAPADRCRTPTARPGYSNHQMGLAIDFSSSGSLIRSKSSSGFIWLNNDLNAKNYGLFNLPSEPWHWSVDAR